MTRTFPQVKDAEPPRRERQAESRRTYHEALIEAEVTEEGKTRRAMEWVSAELRRLMKVARRVGRESEGDGTVRGFRERFEDAGAELNDLNSRGEISL